MIKILNSYDSFRPFTDAEAWLLFKIAAIAEACGWTLLIGGILCQRYLLPGSIAPVKITGQIHGMLFLLYITAAIVLSPSLRWRQRKTLVAGLCSVPPYGSLFFEMWASHQRKNETLRYLSSSLRYRWLLSGHLAKTAAAVG